MIVLTCVLVTGWLLASTIGSLAYFAGEGEDIPLMKNF